MNTRERVLGALGRPTERVADEWYEMLLAKARSNPGRVYTKHYGLGKAMSIVVPPIATQREAGPDS